MSATFDGRGVVVTGAASGIGRATALLLAASGARVLAVDRDEAGAARVASEAEGEVLPFAADVTDAEQVAAYVAAGRERLGRIHGFFNNAGVEGVHRDIVDTGDDEWDAVLAVNLRSAFLGLKHVLRAMREDGGGAVVNTGSILSLKAAPGRADYVVSKHAVVGLTRSAACEEAPHGTRVNCICPGPIETPLMRRSEELVNPDDPEFERKRFEAGTPVGRYGRPEEVAETVAFLLSDRVPYLTGAIVAVDGGIMTV